eukprot:10938485-Alexandrium_andersonii.AAC.1
MREQRRRPHPSRASGDQFCGHSWAHAVQASNASGDPAFSRRLEPGAAGGVALHAAPPALGMESWRCRSPR